MTRAGILEVVVRTINLIESEFDGRTEHVGILAAGEIADMIYADPTLPDGRGGGMVAPSESPRQARDRINGFKKD